MKREKNDNFGEFEFNKNCPITTPERLVNQNIFLIFLTLGAQYISSIDCFLSSKSNEHFCHHFESFFTNTSMLHKSNKEFKTINNIEAKIFSFF